MYRHIMLFSSIMESKPITSAQIQETTRKSALEMGLDEINIDGIEFPDIKNTDTYVHFQPYNDRLNIYKTNEQFQFYNSQSLFDGDLLLRPTGITGSGEMAFNNAKISSTYFTYNAQWFDSDTTSLEVLEESGKIAFNASNLKSHIDVSMQEGVFLSNGEGSFVECC